LLHPQKNRETKLVAKPFGDRVIQFTSCTPTDACRRRGVHGDDQTWSSIMPIIFDVLYREFCRARLAEMRKQLLLWRGTPVVPEENCEAGHPDDAADRGIDFSMRQTVRQITHYIMSK
jgi:hypothetical protein